MFHFLIRADARKPFPRIARLIVPLAFGMPGMSEGPRWYDRKKFALARMPSSKPDRHLDAGARAFPGLSFEAGLSRGLGTRFASSC